MNRRDSLRILGASSAGIMALPVFSMDLTNQMAQRKIPSSGELLPVVGLGTWQTFDVGSSGFEPLRDVLKILREKGGSVIDSSPMYGRSESVVGELTYESGNPESYFYATKVWTRGMEAGISRMKDSFRFMKRETMDLMQIHNLLDWQTHLQTLRSMKEEGKIRYIGLTHYTIPSHERLEEIIRKEKGIDFIQFNYSIGVRNAENRLLNAAKDLGVAVIINRPYEGGTLFSQIRGKSLPAWAAEYDIHSWGQYFLKFILSHPSVNCVIPGTDKARHMIDNAGAGYGKLPDMEGRKKMVSYFENL